MPHKKIARQLLSLIDLTSLNDTDTDLSIKALCQNAITEFGHVAAVCVYPQFVSLACEQLAGSFVKVATVCNFPSGNDSINDVCAAIHQSIQDGAQEIDVVIPYQNFIDASGNQLVEDFVKRCKQACGEHVLLKTILETGALQTNELIESASKAAITGGADFLKTSTGKIAQGASLQAAEVMLNTIVKSGKDVGFKASGGIRTMPQAEEYLSLTRKIMGNDWINPQHLRFGASGLLVDLLQKLNPPSN